MVIVNFNSNNNVENSINKITLHLIILLTLIMVLTMTIMPMIKLIMNTVILENSTM